MRVQDLDSVNSVGSTDEIMVTHTNHKTERITFENFKGSIDTLDNLEVTTLLQATGDTELADTTVTGDIDVTGDLDITGDVDITGDLNVEGNIIQHGSAYETHAEKVYTKDDVINLRDGAVGALGNDEYSGVIAKHYDADGNDGALVFNKHGEARVGDYTKTDVTVYSANGTDFYTDAEMTQAATIPAGVTPVLVEGDEYTYVDVDDDTEPLLTRDETASMTDKGIITWDATNKKANTLPVATSANKVLASDSNGGYQWMDVGASAAQSIFDICHPIDEVYVQFPQQDDPTTLYNKNGIQSTWTLLDFSGAFFRASGGNAANFVEKTDVLTKQAQATAKNGLQLKSATSGGTDNTTSGMSGNSTGSFLNRVLDNGSTIVGAVNGATQASASASGNFSASWKTGYSNSGGAAQASGYNHQDKRSQISLNVAHTHNVYLQGDTETRPDNYTVKIWKRTA